MASSIRPGRKSDIAHLPEIEKSAAVLFVKHGWGDESVLEDCIPVERHDAYRQAGHLWVAVNASDQPIAFAVISLVDDHPHLDEIDVHPEYGRQGIGKALIDTICDWAKDEGYTTLTLTTERDIPWNAPYYQRLGFQIMETDSLSPALFAIFKQEAEHGLSPETRVAMIKGI